MHMCVVNCFMSCPTLCNPMDCTTHRLLCPWDSLGKNIGVSCHALLQGIFLTQRFSLCLLYLLHWQGCSLPIVAPEKPMKDYTVLQCLHTCLQI